ncbi:MAG TPA: hypothetical protein VIS57_04285 [Xanthomonadales bacterium]
MLCLLWDVTLAKTGDVRPGDAVAAADLNIVLLHASATPESPYLLQVYCTDHSGNRSLELFPGAAAIWNGRSQILLPPSARSSLLRILVDRGFAGFEDRYGGAESAKSEAAARISCRVRIEIENLEKRSVQMVGGKPATPLSDLATELLDQAARYADSAVTPVDLQDALEKLSDGQLFPQVLRLRFLDLPARGDDNPGTLLRLVGGRLSRQAYLPGRPLEEPRVTPLEDDQYTRLVAAMQKAQLAGLPANLWSEGTVELEVQVLAHKKVVLARRFSRLESASLESVQQRFDTLLFALRHLAD